MEVEKQLIRDQLLLFEAEKYPISPNHCCNCNKDSEISRQAKHEADVLHLGKHKDHTPELHLRILNLLNKSVAFAVPDVGDELGEAYAGRSKLLYHMKLWRECLEDIDRAFKVAGLSVGLRVRLFCLKVACVHAMGWPKEHDNIYQEADEFFKSLSKKMNVSDEVKRAKSLLSQQRNPSVIAVKNDKLAAYQNLNIFDRVNVKRSKEHGRYLVAKTNYVPGDVILVEKPYAIFPNTNFPYAYCYHCGCLAVTGVPCPKCTWCVFCSEKCKDEAEKEYHQNECLVMPYIEGTNGLSIYQKLAFRLLLMGIREAGSLTKLMEEVQNDLVTNCYDDIELYKASLSEGLKKGKTFKYICTLMDNVCNELLPVIAKSTVQFLISVVHFSSIYWKGYFQTNTYTDASQNECILFLGALIFKLTKIVYCNQYYIQNLVMPDKKSPIYIQTDIDCNPRGSALTLIGSFVNNSCSPNAFASFTHDSKLVLYALESIEADSQIFISYTCSFDATPKDFDRKVTINVQYNFICKCIACEKNWISFMFDSKELNEYMDSICGVEEQVLEDALTIADELPLIKTDEEMEKNIQVISEKIDVVSILLDEPSIGISMLKNLLSKLLVQFYCLNKYPLDECNYSTI